MRVGGCEKRRVAVWRPQSARSLGTTVGAVVALCTAKCFLGGGKTHVAVGAFCGWAGLNAFWEAAESHVAVEGPWSLELLHWVGMA